MAHTWHKHLRPMFKYIKKNYDISKPLVGVELGIKGGRNDYYILTGLPIKMLYMVDCYDKRHKPTKSSMEENILNVFTDNTKFIYKKSVDAVDDIPNNLDFVYIDTNHTYENTRDEIMLYYEKMKQGGILGGHDYNFGGGGVKKAVDEFVEKEELELHKKHDDEDPDSISKRATDWWVIKR